MGGSVSLFEENNWELANGKIEPIIVNNEYNNSEEGGGWDVSIPTYQRARNHTQTIDGSPPTTQYQIYWLTKRGTFNLNQREYDITDNESNLLYTTKAVPGTLACFDVLHGITQKSILRISVDLSRRYWIVYRFHHPIYPGQYPDQSEQLQTLFQNDPKYQLEILNYQMIRNTTIDTVDDNDIDDDDDDDIIENPPPPSANSDETPLPGLYKVCCVTVSWSRYMAVSTMYGPPTEQQIDHYLQRQLLEHEQQIQVQNQNQDKEMLPQLLLYDNNNNNNDPNNNNDDDEIPNVVQPPTPTILIDETTNVAYERSIEVPKDPSTRYITDTTSVVNEGSIEVPKDTSDVVDNTTKEEDHDNNNVIEQQSATTPNAEEQSEAETTTTPKSDDTVNDTNDYTIENTINKSNVDYDQAREKTSDENKEDNEVICDSNDNENDDDDDEVDKNNKDAVVAVDTEQLPTNELTETENNNITTTVDIGATPKSIVSTGTSSSLFDTLSSSSSVASSSLSKNDCTDKVTNDVTNDDGQQQQYVPNRTRAVSEYQPSQGENVNNDYPFQRVGESMPNLLDTTSSNSDIVQLDSSFDEMDNDYYDDTDQVDTTKDATTPAVAASSDTTTTPEEPILLVPFKSNYSGFSYKNDIIKKKREKRIQALKSWLPKRNTTSSNSHRSENYASISIQSPDNMGKSTTTEATNLPLSPSLDPNSGSYHQTQSEPSSPAMEKKESCLSDNSRTSKSVSPKERKARPVLTFLNKSISAASSAVSTSIANSSITNSISSNGITTTRASALLTTIKSSVTSSGNSTTPNLASSGIPGADEDNPLLGTIDLDNKPIILCQEIYNKIIGNWQSSRITKQKALELLKADAKQQRAAENGGTAETIKEEHEEEQEVIETKNKSGKKEDDLSFGMKLFSQIQAKIKDDKKVPATTNRPSNTDDEVSSNPNNKPEVPLEESQEESIESFQTIVEGGTSTMKVESQNKSDDPTEQIEEGATLPNPDVSSDTNIDDNETKRDENNNNNNNKEGCDDETDTTKEQQQQQPLIGYWNWENTMRTHRMKLHLAAGSDLALHIVIAILVNQVRYERNAIALTV